jgi:hypothetical protein
MTASPRVSNAAAKAALDARLTLLGTAGYIEIRTGAPPTNVEDAATGTLLSTHVLSNPAFAASIDANPGARATANGIGSSLAVANGTAGWFRAYDSGGTGIIQGNVGTSASDLIMATTTVVIGLNIAISSWTVNQPET